MVGVAVGAAGPDGAELFESHPAIKATGSKTIIIKLTIIFFTFASPLNLFETPHLLMEFSHFSF
jgi:hypothetical protein